MKLGRVTDRLASFASELDCATQNRKQADSTRYQALSESVHRLDQNLQAEIARRAERDLRLQQQLADMDAVSHGLKVALDGLTATVQALQDSLAAESAARQSDLEHLATGLVSKVNECVDALAAETAERERSVAEVRQAAAGEAGRLAGALQEAAAAQTAALQALRQEVEAGAAETAAREELWQGAAVADIAELKAALAAEREERIQEDDAIVVAVNDYTAAMQEGLRLVAQQ